ncbi:MAG: hypothetical protein OES29_10805 [Desulfuromonadales bacterium]|nr:hypothetical protein [Desulfuromonadales bacterium]
MRKIAAGRTNTSFLAMLDRSSVGTDSLSGQVNIRRERNVNS